MQIRKLIPLLTIVALTACNEKEPEPIVARINEKPITRAQFNAYLKFKKAPDRVGKQAETLLKKYIEREALAAAI